MLLNLKFLLEFHICIALIWAFVEFSIINLRCSPLVWFIIFAATAKIPSCSHERNPATDSRKRGIKLKSSLRVKSIIDDKS